MLSPNAAVQINLLALRRAPQPVSAAGRRLRDTAAPSAPAAVDTLRAHLARRASLDDALGSDPLLYDHLIGVLRTLGDPAQALASLGEDGPLDEAELFALNTLLHVTVTARSHAPHHGPLATLDGAALDRALAILHGGAPPSHRFRLRDAHDPERASARERLAIATRTRIERARSQRERIEQDFGASLSPDRTLVLPVGDPRIPRAAADPRLDTRQSSPWEQVFGLVPDAEDATAEQEEHEARTHLDAVEARARAALSRALRAHAGTLEDALRAVATLDLDLALCALRAKWHGSWPATGDELAIDDGRLPSVADRLGQDGGTLQPVSFALQSGVTLLVGPNMGGKTQTLTLTATVQWLAQMGWPSPARRVRFRPVDHIAWIGGDPGSLHGGLSRFGAELAALRDALDAPGEGLLLLDEPGSATNPAEGAALTAAIAEHLHGTHHTALLATHFPGLRASVPLPTLRVAGLGEVTDEALRAAARDEGERDALQRLMDYRLLPEGDRQPGRDALRIAAAFQLPEALLRRARALLDPDIDTP